MSAIPESRESMLDENSKLGTVRTNRFCSHRFSGSMVGSDVPEKCNCCTSCLDKKRLSNY